MCVCVCVFHFFLFIWLVREGDKERKKRQYFFQAVYGGPCLHIQHRQYLNTGNICSGGLRRPMPPHSTHGRKGKTTASSSSVSICTFASVKQVHLSTRKENTASFWRSQEAQRQYLYFCISKASKLSTRKENTASFWRSQEAQV